MTVTTGEARTVPVTCAPRWDGTTEVIHVRPEWAPVAEKLATVGRRRTALPHPSPQRRDEQESQLREEIWDEIRCIWYDEARRTVPPMSADTGMKLLGLSRQAFYNVVNHQVGAQSQGPLGPPATRGAAYIRAWAREHGHVVPDHGPIPREVFTVYMEAMGDQ